MYVLHIVDSDNQYFLWLLSTKDLAHILFYIKSMYLINIFSVIIENMFEYLLV